MNKKYKTLFSNTAIFAASSIISKIILSLMLPLYTRTLTTGEYGITELIATLSALIYPALSLSIHSSAFRYAMDLSKDKHEVLKNAMIVGINGCIMLVPATFIVGKCFSILSNYFWTFYLFSVFAIIRGILSLYVKGINKTLIFSIDTVLYNFTLAISNIILMAWLKRGFAGYFLSIWIASIVSIGFLLYYSEALLAIKAKYNRKLMREMIGYSAPLVLNSISWGLTHVVDRVMLTSMIGAEANGIYSAAAKVPALLSMFTTVFAEAWTISLIRDFETEKDSSFYNSVFRITHIGGVICSAFILLFNNNILAWILGASFRDSVTYVPVLLIGTLFLTYSNFFGSFFSAAKMTKYNMYTSLFGAIVNAVFNYLLIPSFGIMGACIATAGSYMCISVSRIVLSRRIQYVDISIASSSVSLLLIAISALAVIFRKYEWPIVLMTIVLLVYIYRKSLVIICSFLSSKIEAIFTKK